MTHVENMKKQIIQVDHNDMGYFAPIIKDCTIDVSFAVHQKAETIYMRLEYKYHHSQGGHNDYTLHYMYRKGKWTTMER